MINVIDSVSNDLWNYGTPAGAGSLGLWYESPIWSNII